MDSVPAETTDSVVVCGKLSKTLQDLVKCFWDTVKRPNKLVNLVSTRFNHNLAYLGIMTLSWHLCIRISRLKAIIIMKKCDALLLKAYLLLAPNHLAPRDETKSPYKTVESLSLTNHILRCTKP